VKSLDHDLAGSNAERGQRQREDGQERHRRTVEPPFASRRSKLLEAERREVFADKHGIVEPGSQSSRAGSFCSAQQLEQNPVEQSSLICS
jgi:hypothetical protein